MCLAVIAVNALTDWPLIILANRDEFHERPTESLGVWPDAQHILAGRDLRACGTWLGVSGKGNIGLLTNVREPGKNNPEASSRGQLVENYLRGHCSANEYLMSLQAQPGRYNGFNLLLADQAGIWFTSNRSSHQTQPLADGIYGLSNASLDTPWPKLTRTREAVRTSLLNKNAPDKEQLLDIFLDRQTALQDQLPQTGLSAERERLLSSPFILDERYGTRCTSLILRHISGHIEFYERSFSSQGQMTGQKAWIIDTTTGAIQYNDRNKLNII